MSSSPVDDSPSTQPQNRSFYDILPATRADIPRLAEIHVVTCMEDRLFRHYEPNATTFHQSISSMLSAQIGAPTWTHMKAVEKSTGLIISWASWNTPSDEEIRDRDSNYTPHRDTGSLFHSEISAPGPRSSENAQPTKESRSDSYTYNSGLPSAINDHTQQWFQHITYHKRFMAAKAFFTDPKYQRRGVGRALVQHGNKIADQRGLPIILWGSEPGAGLYASCGFLVMREVDVDLDEWIDDQRKKGEKLGRYTLRYMLRLPLTVPGEDGEQWHGQG